MKAKFLWELVPCILLGVLLSCSKTEVSDVAGEEPDKSEEVPQFTIDLAVTAYYEEYPDSLTTKNYSFDVKGAATLRTGENELEPFLMPAYFGVNSCQLPIAYLLIEITQIAGPGKDLSLARLWLAEELDNTWEVSLDGMHYMPPSKESLSFKTNAGNSKKALLEIDIKPACLEISPEKRAEFWNEFRWRIADSNEEEYLSFKWSVLHKTTYNNYDARLLLYSNASQEAEELLWNLNPDELALLTDPIEISRVHIYGLDNCPEPLAILDLEAAANVLLNNQTLIKSNIEVTLLGSHQNIGVYQGKNISWQSPGTISFDFYCITQDVQAFYEIQLRDVYTNEVITIPVIVSVDYVGP